MGTEGPFALLALSFLGAAVLIFHRGASLRCDANHPGLAQEVSPEIDRNVARATSTGTSAFHPHIGHSSNRACISEADTAQPAGGWVKASSTA